MRRNESSVSNVTVFQAITEAKKSIGAVGKTQQNVQQHFRFRGIDNVVNAVAPAFSELGIIVVPELQEHEYETITTSGGKPMGHVTVVVKYTFYGPAGDSLAAVVAGEAFDAGDKAVAKAMSVAFRTALLQTLTLPTDEPDPDSETYERSARTPVGKPARAAAQPADERPWDQRIREAQTLDELRMVWKDAGTAGILKGAVQEQLYKRSDELSLKSDSGALVGTGAN
jgi:ERF superfamily protein